MQTGIGASMVNEINKLSRIKTLLNQIISFVIDSYRISGNAASSKNIHGTVSEQLKKNFAKSRWKVNKPRHNFYHAAD